MVCWPTVPVSPCSSAGNQPKNLCIKCSAAKAIFCLIFSPVGSISYRHLPRLPPSPDDQVVSSSSSPTIPPDAIDQISDAQESSSGRTRLQLPPINLGLGCVPSCSVWHQVFWGPFIFLPLCAGTVFSYFLILSSASLNYRIVWLSLIVVIGIR